MRNCIIIFGLLSLSFCTQAQEKTIGIPITVELRTSTNLTDGRVELGGKCPTVNTEPALVYVEIIKPGGGADKLSARSDKQTDEYFVKYTPKEPGKYQVIAYPSDKKQTAKTTFDVVAEFDAEEILESLEKTPEQTLLSLESALMKAVNASKIGGEDLSTTKEKVAAVKIKVASFKKALAELKAALQQTEKMYPSMPQVRSWMAEPLGKLGSIAEQTEKNLKQVKESMADNSKREPDVCNSAYVIGEGATLFSTAMNFATLNILTVMKNISIDKVWPKVNEVYITPKAADTDGQFAFTQAGKLYFGAMRSLEDLKNSSTPLGIAGDLTQHVMKRLFKKYCSEYSGPMEGSFLLEFKNNGKMYMRYTMHYKGKISLYASKSSLQKGGEPKLNGHIEGNITKMDFTDDVWAVEEKKGWKVLTYKRFPAIASNFSMVEKDPGFGAAARMAVPGSFYFPLKGQISGDKMVVRLQPAVRDLDQMMANRSLVAVQRTNNELSLQAQVFSYPITTAKFFLTRSMRMPESAPVASFNMKKEGEKTIIEETFSRTETPADTRVEFNLKFKMTNE